MDAAKWFKCLAVCVIYGISFVVVLHKLLPPKQTTKKYVIIPQQRHEKEVVLRTHDDYYIRVELQHGRCVQNDLLTYERLESLRGTYY